MFGNSDDNVGQPQDQPNQTDGQAAPAPAVDAGSTPSAPSTPADLSSGPADYSQADTGAQTPSAPAMDNNAATPSARAPQNGSDDLLDIKQQALQQLAPLVSHLDQTPEEEFRTTMMMIQASDNQDLISKAYEAAQKITDEKAKAQALLDIVNEINYFTQQHEGQEPDDK